MPKITGVDHIVLNVSDIEASLRFYIEVLGLDPERQEAFRRGEVEFPSVRVNDAFVIDLFPQPASPSQGNNRVENMNHFCLVAGKKAFAELQARLKAHGVPIDAGPLPRWGARGTGTSIYFRDPDGNHIELRSYA